MNTQSTKYAGIDYGNGATNQDKANGIRYGVLPQNEVLQAWADSSEPDYGSPCECECPECGEGIKPNCEWGDSVECPNCKQSFEVELPDMAEPLGYTYSHDGYEATSGTDSGDIFVTKSPYFTYAQFCSPCAPGACYLPSPLNTTEPDNTPSGVSFHDIYANNRCYCFGHDWFEDGQAPYPVYSVETGDLVNP